MSAEGRPARVGIGFDSHPLVDGLPLRLGGVTIPFPRGLSGHSDGDVLLHALIDAMLGASELGDIGTLFPDTDVRWKGIDSRVLLQEAHARVKDAGFEVAFVDAVVIARAPRLSAHREAIVASIRDALYLPHLPVSVKGKSGQGIVAFDDERAVACLVTATLVQRARP